MTREESIKNTDNFFAGNKDAIGLYQMIDKIYNDFESRTCDNCIYFNQRTSVDLCINNALCNALGVDSDKYMQVYPSFGCNEFLKKETK